MKTTTYKINDDNTVSVIQHTISEELNNEIKKLGWESVLWGAEGEYLRKGDYGLQLIEQTIETPSVINENWKLEGLQNLHIYHIQKVDMRNKKSKYYWLNMPFGKGIQIIIHKFKNKYTTVDEQHTLFYGYCRDIEDFKTICRFLGI